MVTSTQIAKYVKNKSIREKKAVEINSIIKHFKLSKKIVEKKLLIEAKKGTVYNEGTWGTTSRWRPLY